MREEKVNRHQLFVKEIRQQLDDAMLEERKIQNSIEVVGINDDSDSSISLQKELEAKFEELFGPFDED